MASGAYSDEDDGLISSINVTPLVDIFMVLLIIMMVTAKIIVSSALQLDLPQAAKGDTVQVVFALNLRSSGEMIVDNKTVSDDKAVLALAIEALANDKDLRAVIRADKTVQHGRIITVLDLLKQAGVTKIAFGVQPISAEPLPTDSDLPEDTAPKDTAPKEAPPEGK
jgi:biopolymer transport protein ExbD